MRATKRLEQRPLAFEEGNFYWNIQRVPRTLPDGTTPHPGRSSAVFVVHGIGQQHWTETAAQLRAGLEDAFEDISAWQQKNLNQAEDGDPITLPPPFVFEGYWANYDAIKETFPDDWKQFVKREQDFFSNIWRQRVVSGARVLRWMICQQLYLLHPRVLFEVGPLAWILYGPTRAKLL